MTTEINPAFAPFADLLPPVTDLMREYYDGLAAGVLRMQHCKSCGNYQHPPESFCYHCPSTDLEWETVSGHGSVYSFIVVHQRYHPAFAELLPYVVAAVQLDEGPRMLGMLVEDPENVEIGTRVQPRIERVSEERGVLFFQRED